MTENSYSSIRRSRGMALDTLPDVLRLRINSDTGTCKLSGFQIRFVEEISQRDKRTALSEEFQLFDCLRIFRVFVAENDAVSEIGGEQMRLLFISDTQNRASIGELNTILNTLDNEAAAGVLPKPVDMWNLDDVVMLLTSDPLQGTKRFSLAQWKALEPRLAVEFLIRLTCVMDSLHRSGFAIGQLLHVDIAVKSDSTDVKLGQLCQIVSMQHLDRELVLELVDRDIRTIGELLLQVFTDIPLAQALEMFEHFYESPRELVDSGLLEPGLTQVLVGALVPEPESTYPNMRALLDGLLQLRIEMVRPLTVRTGIASSCGNYPLRRTDQDSAGMAQTRYAYNGLQRHLGFYCVADGVGGEVAGELASQLAIQGALGSFHRALGGYTYEDLYGYVTPFARYMTKAAAARLAIGGEEEPEVHRGATTFTGLFIADNRAGIGHVGDSRAYLLRDGRLTLLTRDHNLANIKMAVGELTREEAQASDEDLRQLARYLDTGQETPMTWIDGFDPALLPHLVQTENLDEAQNAAPHQLFAVSTKPASDPSLPAPPPSTRSLIDPLGALLAPAITSALDSDLKTALTPSKRPRPFTGLEEHAPPFYDIPSEKSARTSYLEVRHGDRFLLASDGIDDLKRSFILDVLSRSNNPDAAARRLTEAAMRAYSMDNVTAMVLFVELAEANFKL